MEVKDQNKVVGYDYPRATDPGKSDNLAAEIPDARNDENQLIAQIQILLERLHNSFGDAGSIFEAAKL